MNAYEHFCPPNCAEHRRTRLLTNAEFQAAQRYWDRIGMDDPTVDAPPVPDTDAPECCDWLES